MNAHVAPTPTPRPRWYDSLARLLRLQRPVDDTPPKPLTMRQELLAAQERRLAEKRELLREQSRAARRIRH